MDILTLVHLLDIELDCRLEVKGMHTRTHDQTVFFMHIHPRQLDNEDLCRTLTLPSKPETSDTY
ncbi:hypothetical protein BD310DRAFT_276842 [Dichomitus squalens]|uniref:Uncharacterized protein n=1 Tax=Dichomitus squalens TaxID=114155 RepID=A0A4Q9PBJ0_9APHY|nr:hypothetical protein BD310DRAFT_276842 [Dichomitus squalens]